MMGNHGCEYIKSVLHSKLISAAWADYNEMIYSIDLDWF